MMCWSQIDSVPCSSKKICIDFFFVLFSSNAYQMHEKSGGSEEKDPNPIKYDIITVFTRGDLEPCVIILWRGIEGRINRYSCLCPSAGCNLCGRAYVDRDYRGG